jgi:hypothetical protein
MNFFIEVSGTEYRLYRYRGEVFFIVKYKFGKYYTSQLYEYEPIIEELKHWVIEIVNENKENTTHITFNYDFIIKPMFIKHIREEKLKKILE